MSEDKRAAARDNLLRELRDLSHAVTRQAWADEIQYQLYAVMVGDAENIGGKPLAAALLSHIDALPRLSELAGGWFADNDPAAFVDLDEWEKKYDAWRAAKPK